MISFRTLNGRESLRTKKRGRSKGERTGGRAVTKNEAKEQERLTNATPLKTIRRFCLRCTGGCSSDVRACKGKLIGQGDEKGVCYFHRYRMGKGRPSVKEIRRHCLECMGGSRKAIRECPDESCPTWPYRMGRNPNRKGIGGKPPPKRRRTRPVRREMPPDNTVPVLGGITPPYVSS